jgi:hypothetical protein
LSPGYSGRRDMNQLVRFTVQGKRSFHREREYIIPQPEPFEQLADRRGNDGLVHVVLLDAHVVAAMRRSRNNYRECRTE